MEMLLSLNGDENIGHEDMREYTSAAKRFSCRSVHGNLLLVVGKGRCWVCDTLL